MRYFIITILLAFNINGHLNALEQSMGRELFIHKPTGAKSNNNNLWKEYINPLEIIQQSFDLSKTDNQEYEYFLIDKLIRIADLAASNDQTGIKNNGNVAHIDSTYSYYFLDHYAEEILTEKEYFQYNNDGKQVRSESWTTPFEHANNLSETHYNEQGLIERSELSSWNGNEYVVWFEIMYEYDHLGNIIYTEFGSFNSANGDRISGFRFNYEFDEIYNLPSFQLTQSWVNSDWLNSNQQEWEYFDDGKLKSFSSLATADGGNLWSLGEKIEYYNYHGEHSTGHIEFKYDKEMQNWIPENNVIIDIYDEAGLWNSYIWKKWNSTQQEWNNYIKYEHFRNVETSLVDSIYTFLGPAYDLVTESDWWATEKILFYYTDKTSSQIAITLNRENEMAEWINSKRNFIGFDQNDLKVLETIEVWIEELNDWQFMQKDEFEYDESGMTILHATDIWSVENQDWVHEIRLTKNYADNGDVIHDQREIYSEHHGRFYSEYKNIMEFDSVQRLTIKQLMHNQDPETLEWGNGERHLFKFDNYSYTNSITLELWNPELQSFEISETNEYVFDYYKNEKARKYKEPWMSNDRYIRKKSFVTYDISLIIEGYGNPLADAVLTIDSTEYVSSYNGEIYLHFTTGSQMDVSYSIEKNGFKKVSDSFLIDRNFTETITLTPLDVQTFFVLFKIADKDHAIPGAIVYLESYGQIVTEANGEALYERVVPQDSIPYTVNIQGMDIISGLVSVNDQDVELNLDVSLLNVSDANNNITSIFPNPSSNHITILQKNNSLVQIIDLQGKILLEKTITEDNQAIYLDRFVSGNYILRITDDNAIKYHKVQIIR